MSQDSFYSCNRLSIIPFTKSSKRTFILLGQNTFGACSVPTIDIPGADGSTCVLSYANTLLRRGYGFTNFTNRQLDTTFSRQVNWYIDDGTFIITFDLESMQRGRGIQEQLCNVSTMSDKCKIFSKIVLVDTISKEILDTNKDSYINTCTKKLIQNFAI